MKQHITGYPVVSDSIDAFKSNPYGQKSIEITDTAYANLVKPTFPYLKTPASYVKPYAAKADELGDSLLSKFDEKLPIVKKETSEIKKDVIDLAQWPFKLADEQKDYVLKTYSSEYKKCGGDGVVAGTKALVSSSFIITSDWFAFFASLLQRKTNEAKDAFNNADKVVAEKIQQARETATEGSQQVKEKGEEAKQTAEEKTSN